MVDAKTVYLQEHNIPELVDTLINKLVDEQPANPKEFLGKCLLSREQLADTAKEHSYVVAMHGQAPGAAVFSKLDFSAMGGVTVTGDGRSVGSTREQPGLDASFHETLVERSVATHERKYTYTLSSSNSLGIKGFSATLRVLSSTVDPQSSCFVTWSATWEQTGELHSLQLPAFVGELIEGAVQECSKATLGG